MLHRLVRQEAVLMALITSHDWLAWRARTFFCWLGSTQNSNQK
jgi:hypothetical protein